MLEFCEGCEQSPTIEEVTDFLEKIMLKIDSNPWIERQDNTLIIAGTMAFASNITKRRGEVYGQLKNSPYFENVRQEDGNLAISADLRSPIGNIVKIHFRVDKDM
jgi:hypothetical protein